MEEGCLLSGAAKSSQYWRLRRVRRKCNPKHVRSVAVPCKQPNVPFSCRGHGMFTSTFPLRKQVGVVQTEANGILRWSSWRGRDRSGRINGSKSVKGQAPTPVVQTVFFQKSYNPLGCITPTHPLTGREFPKRYFPARLRMGFLPRCWRKQSTLQSPVLPNQPVHAIGFRPNRT